MSLQRTDYFRDLAQDAESISQEPQIIAALVLSDSLNGLRKALLDISENVRISSEAQADVAGSVEALMDIVERNLK
jgi:hypothetical protein